MTVGLESEQWLCNKKEDNQKNQSTNKHYDSMCTLHMESFSYFTVGQFSDSVLAVLR